MALDLKSAVVTSPGLDLAAAAVDDAAPLVTDNGRFRVIDGDTVEDLSTVDEDTGRPMRLRLGGIDTAETEMPVSAASKSALFNALNSAGDVAVELTGDVHKERRLANLRTPDGRSLNEYMVTTGGAEATTFGDAPYVQQGRAASLGVAGIGNRTPEQQAMDQRIRAEGAQLAQQQYIPPQPRARKKTLSQEFASGVARGTDTLQGAGYGALALIGSAIEVDKLKELGFENYERNVREAAQNAATVSFKEMEVGDNFFQWASGALGEAVPSLGLSVAGGGTGAYAGRKLVQQQLTKHITDKARKDLLRYPGVDKETADAWMGFALQDARTHLALKSSLEAAYSGGKRGAVGGLFASSAVPQSGEIFADIHEATGKEAVGTALLAGGLGGYLDALPGQRLINHLFPGVDDKIAKDFIKRWAALVPAQTVIEGSTEAAQEFIANVARAYEDPDYDPLGEEAMDRVYAAAATGALVGAVTGTIASPFGGRGAAEEKDNEKQRTDDVRGVGAAAGAGAGGGGAAPAAAGVGGSGVGGGGAVPGGPGGIDAAAAEAPALDPLDQRVDFTFGTPEDPAPAAVPRPKARTIREYQAEQKPPVEPEPEREAVPQKKAATAPKKAVVPPAEPEPEQKPAATETLKGMAARLAENGALSREQIAEVLVTAGARPGQATSLAGQAVRTNKPTKEESGAAEVVTREKTKTPAAAPTAKPAPPKAEPAESKPEKVGLGFEDLPEGLVLQRPTPIDIKAMRSLVRTVADEQPLQAEHLSLLEHLTTRTTVDKDGVEHYARSPERAERLFTEIEARVRRLDRDTLSPLEDDGDSDAAQILAATQTSGTSTSVVHEGQGALTETAPEGEAAEPVVIRHGRNKGKGNFAMPILALAEAKTKLAELEAAHKASLPDGADPRSSFSIQKISWTNAATGRQKQGWYIDETSHADALPDLNAVPTPEDVQWMQHYTAREREHVDKSTGEVVTSKTRDRPVTEGSPGAVKVYTTARPGEKRVPVTYVNVPALIKWGRERMPRIEGLTHEERIRQALSFALDALASLPREANRGPLSLTPHDATQREALSAEREVAVLQAEQALEAAQDSKNKKRITAAKRALTDARILRRTGIPADTLVVPNKDADKRLVWRDVIKNRPVKNPAQILADREARLAKLTQRLATLRAREPQLMQKLKATWAALQKPDLAARARSNLQWEFGKLLETNNELAGRLEEFLKTKPGLRPYTALMQMTQGDIKAQTLAVEQARKDVAEHATRLEREPGIGNKQLDLTESPDELNYVDDELEGDSAEQAISDTTFVAPDPFADEPGDTTKSEEEKTGLNAAMQADGRFDMSGANLSYSTVPPRKAALRKVSRQIDEARAVAKAAERTAPDVRGLGGIPAREVTLVEELAKLFNLNMRITVGDQTALKLYGRDLPPGRIMYRGEEIVIFVNANETDPVRRVAIIGHELGHAIMYAHSQALTTKQRDALITAHHKALTENPDETSAIFEEWFADQATAYAMKHHRSAVENAGIDRAALQQEAAGARTTARLVNVLFRQAARKLRALYQRLSTGRFALSETYEEFLNGIRSKGLKGTYIASRPSDMWSDIELPSGVQQQVQRARRTRVGQLMEYGARDSQRILKSLADNYVGSVTRWFRVQKNAAGQAIDALLTLDNSYRLEPGKSVDAALLPKQQRAFGGPEVPVTEGMEHATQRAQGRFTKVVNDVIARVEARHRGRYNPRQRGQWKVAVSADLEAIARELQQGLPDTQLSEDALAIRKMLRSMHTYLKDAIPDLGKIDNYFPHVYDLAPATGNHDAFIAMLTNPESWKKPQQVMTEEQAEEVYAKLQESGGFTTETEGLEGRRAREHGSRFDFKGARGLIDLKDAAVEPFLMKDLVGTLRTYIHSGVRRAEHDRRFGRYVEKTRWNPATRQRETYLEWDSNVELNRLKGEALREMGRYEQTTVGGPRQWVPAPPDQVAQLETMLRALRGQLGANLDPKWRHVMGWLMTFQNYLVLAFSQLASLPDLGGLAIRSRSVGMAWQAMREGARETLAHYKGRDGELWSLGEMLGVLTDEMHSVALQEQYGMQYLSGSARRANELLFRANGLHYFTLMTRAMGLSLGRLFLARNAADAQGNDQRAARAKRYLSELGLTANDVLPFVGTDGRLLAQSEATTPAELKLQQALNRFVNESILRPSASQKPAWGSDPRFMLLFHLKSFAYTFWETIVRQSINETKARRANRAAEGGGLLDTATPGALAALTLLPLAAAALYLRDMLTYGPEGHPRRQDFDFEWFFEIVQRSGVTGPGLQMFLDTEEAESRGKLGAVGLLGPTVSRTYDLAVEDWDADMAVKQIPLLSQVPWMRDKFKDLLGI